MSSACFKFDGNFYAVEGPMQLDEATLRRRLGARGMRVLRLLGGVTTAVGASDEEDEGPLFDRPRTRERAAGAPTSG